MHARTLSSLTYGFSGVHGQTQTHIYTLRYTRVCHCCLGTLGLRHTNVNSGHISMTFAHPQHENEVWHTHTHTHTQTGCKFCVQHVVHEWMREWGKYMNTGCFWSVCLCIL